MMKEYITLNEQGFADASGWVVCYLTSPDGEYLGFIDEFIPATAGLPAGAYIDEPPADEAGKAIIRVGDKWELVDDHRGEIVYSTENGQPVEVKALGDYPDNTTPLAPATAFDKWNGSAWVTDEAQLKAGEIAETEARRAQLRAQADSEIAWRQYAVDRGKATNEETAALIEWQDYRLDLMRVNPEKPYWPPLPGAQAS